ncbi:MAG: chromosome segregation protein SMC [Hyphomonas sp.]|uniref:chromosome segregation protein SMC n=1 Tax=Hyphomonas sp. TaxID=87 RepID=UPI00183FD0B5|nr:chromosome segregation protein SMC [Hyphomonas sp.]MBA3069800.1 chromosome segregation protein SMC [Hyphomonas sp.]MBU4062641.1 chromosome segregation protein SMC [Alphaproteobacteria bacterium]MBU4163992.1 chromosome segregation protein SMC [Alphaproteobacteria bacterium]
MQITELRIAGFKSFVDPQTVPIEPGLTGIVGPNGCGKSNLLEALRWAMGANSAKAMRGGEMDDLIFNGAQGRPARETAEVILVLDNSKRTAPPEFNGADSLEIERKLKRGAGSSYRINGRTVRGKDIQLLFADASTGANSPALVRQGQISELIGSKPQNRRRILEEAAGIAGLNSRRHEAELKLDGAEANLQRLAEVSAEVERQLSSLKRQAAKARRYRKLSEEIQALDALVAHLRWAEARQTMDLARTQLDTLKRQVEDLSREDALCETARIEAGDGLAPLRDTEMEAAARLGQARITLAKLETERRIAADAHARLEAEALRLIMDLARETTTRDEAAEALAQAREELAGLPEEDAALAEQLERGAHAALETARTRLAEAERAADDAQQRLSELRARRRAAEENAAAQSRRKDHLTAEIDRLKTEMTGLEDAGINLLHLRQAKNAEAEAQIALDDAERAVELAESELARARVSEGEAQPPFDAANHAVRALEAEIAGLTRLMRRAGESSAPPVLDRLRTRDGFEKAVAAALGDDIEAPTDRSAALYWNGAQASAQSLPDGAEPLSHYVDAPGELAARLSQCGLVSLVDGAHLAAGLRPGQRLVSREGHLWRWDGFIRTPDAPVSAAARLEQKARIEAAQTELASRQSELDELAAQLDTARKARLASEETLRHLRQFIAPAQRTLTDARAAAIDATQANERTMLKREAGTEALVRAENDLAAIAEMLALATPGAGAEEEAALEAALASARETLSVARAAETEARGQLADLLRGREQAVARRTALVRDVEAWTTRLASAEERLTQVTERRADVSASVIASKERPEALHAEIEGLAAETERLEIERQAAADALARKDAAIREADSAARRAATAAAEARTQLAAWSVKLENAEAKLAECIEHARNTFQRAPEGLLAIAEAGLDEDELGAFTPREAEAKLDGLRRDRDQLGGVNMNAEEEADELESRLGVQIAERDDLVAAIAKLREGVEALNIEGRQRLIEAFDTVNEHFKALFTALFAGGQAELRLVDADDPLNAGLEIFAQPPGKKLGTLALMSGGEQALTASALIFAVFLSRPAPICVLDEVDAPLDDANVDRFCNMLNEMRQRTDTRFVVITHNPVTMSRMDRLFGVTMREKGVSKLVSVDLAAAERLVAAE